jgi:hypothetical protein
MKIVTWFGEIRKNSLSSLEEMYPYFFEGERQQRREGSIRFYGAEGTDERRLGEGRLDIWLGIVQHPKLGFYLTHSRLGLPDSSVFHSSRDPKWPGHAGEMIEIDDNGYLASENLFVPPFQAWEVVKHFIETQGGRSSAVHWLNGDEMPEGAFQSSIDD